MSKKICVCLLLLLLLVSTKVFSQSMQQLKSTLAQVKIFLNGEELSFEMPVVAIDDRIYVPLREFAEVLGMDVEWDESEKRVDLKNDDLLVSMNILPSSTTTISYQVDVYADGRLESTVGRAIGQVILKDKIHFVTPVFFEPKVTRYKVLTDSEMDEINALLSKIMANEKINHSGCDDGWYFTISYQGKNFYDIFDIPEKLRCYNEHIYELVQKLIDYSPHDIIAFAYGHNAVERQYYEGLDW